VRQAEVDKETIPGAPFANREEASSHAASGTRTRTGTRKVVGCCYLADAMVIENFARSEFPSEFQSQVV
jgi:hypothetical protein